MRRIELAAAEACDVLVTCCTEDRQFFEAQARVRHSVVVPNGIDPSRFDGLEAHRGPMRQALGIADDVRLFLFTASKWGPNREAFDYLLDFARNNREFLESEGIHILVVGNVVAAPLRIPALHGHRQGGRGGAVLRGRRRGAQPDIAAARGRT